MARHQSDSNPLVGIEILKTGGDLPKVDIVAVHGLGANPKYAWVWKDPTDAQSDEPRTVNWLTDLLPDTVPNARIMTYNYESRWDRDAPDVDLQGIADSFMVDLDNERPREARHRPIVFIGHSLGGIVIEKMLVSASKRKKYCHIADNTNGVIFLGSPLHGTTVANWAEIVAIVGEGVGAGSNKSLLGVLKEDGDTVTQLLEEFTEWAVHKDNAVLTGYDKICLPADHFQINKYGSSGDPSFKRVSSQLRSMVDKSSSIVRSLGQDPQNEGDHDFKLNRQSFRDQLFVTDPRDDLDDKVIGSKGEPVRETCKWLQKQDEYRQWQTEPGLQILRLEGEPGMGKTMMSAFLVEDLSKLVGKYSDKMHLALYFFDSNDSKRDETCELLRGLILQLLDQAGAELSDKLFKAHVAQKYSDLRESIFENSKVLWDILMAMAGDDSLGDVFFIIDGLDECRDRRELLRRLQDLTSDKRASTIGLKRVKFYVSSRPGLSMGPPSESFRTITVHAEKIKSDLELFIAVRVGETARSQNWSSHVKEAVHDHLLATADGTFLYISFFLQELGKLHSSEVEQQLNDGTLPPDLKSFYARILNDIPEKDKPAAAWVLRCVVCAVTPLTIEELAVARWIETQHGLPGGNLPSPADYENFGDTLDLCRSLLDHEGETVNLIHKSVKDFLMDDDIREDRELGQFHVGSGVGNWLLFKVCATLLGTKELDSVADGLERKPELQEIYSLLYETTAQGCIWLWSRCACRMDRPGKYWTKVDSCLVPLVKYAAYNWETHAIRAAKASFIRDDLLDNMVPPPIQLSRSWMRSAAANGQTSVVKMLQSHFPYLCDAVNCSRMLQTPLIYAAKNGQDSTVQLLLAWMVFDINSKDRRDRTALMYASKDGHVAVVKSLLSHGADTHCKDRYSRTALQYAAKGTTEDHRRVRDMLIDASQGHVGLKDSFSVFKAGAKRLYSASRPPVTRLDSGESETSLSPPMPSLRSSESSESLRPPDTPSLKSQASKDSLLTLRTLRSHPSREVLTEV